MTDDSNIHARLDNIEQRLDAAITLLATIRTAVLRETNPAPPPSTQTMARPAPTEEVYACPLCRARMKLRQNRANGEYFYGCPRYPDCRGSRRSDGAQRLPNGSIKLPTPEDSVIDDDTDNTPF